MHSAWCLCAFVHSAFVHLAFGLAGPYFESSVDDGGCSNVFISGEVAMQPLQQDLVALDRILLHSTSMLVLGTKIGVKLVDRSLESRQHSATRRRQLHSIGIRRLAFRRLRFGAILSFWSLKGFDLWAFGI